MSSFLLGLVVIMLAWLLVTYGLPIAYFLLKLACFKALGCLVNIALILVYSSIFIGSLLIGLWLFV